MQVYNIDKKEGREEKALINYAEVPTYAGTISSIPYRCICMDIKRARFTFSQNEN
jgi:hypothetical protein